MSESVRGTAVSNTEDVYVRLRDMLLNGDLRPGTPISQVRLARELGVSATPLREAMRLLQAEGLLVAEHNRRARVAPIDPADIEAVYANRILTEALALRLTVPKLHADDFEGLHEDLLAMADAAQQEDLKAWEPAHRRFHRRLVDGADPALVRMIEPLIDRSERYRRVGLAGSAPRMWEIGNDEHEAIVQACEHRDPDLASTLLARHLARSALTALAKVAPEQEPAAIRTALGMVQHSND